MNALCTLLNLLAIFLPSTAITSSAVTSGTGYVRGCMRRSSSAAPAVAGRVIRNLSAAGPPGTNVRVSVRLSLPRAQVHRGPLPPWHGTRPRASNGYRVPCTGAPHRCHTAATPLPRNVRGPLEEALLRDEPVLVQAVQTRYECRLLVVHLQPVLASGGHELRLGDAT